MNKARRKALEEIYNQLEILAGEEQEAFDNMPESLQGSERGQRMEEYIDNIETAKGEIENIIFN